MEITNINVTKISTDSWGEFVEFPLVTVMSKFDEYRNAEEENPQARRKWMGPVVEVETDAGITGVGHGNWATGTIEAMSVVDLALWDIAGKEADKPVYELLGGPVEAEIDCYASNLHPVDHETLEREAIEYAEASFDAMKLRFQHGPEAGRSGMKEIPVTNGMELFANGVMPQFI